MTKVDLSKKNNSGGEEKVFPMRLNRYLALQKACSRREADELISKGAVRINGKKAVIGQKVEKEDKVEVDEKRKGRIKKYLYFAYHKPRGVITHSPSEGETDVRAEGNFPKGVAPVGRLDKDSEGLMILTNDGRVNKLLLAPESEREKEYLVRVDRDINNLLLKVLERGVDLGSFVTRPAKVKKIDDRNLRLVITEGKKHQVRRMCAAMGYGVSGLKRVRVGNVLLGKMKPGEKRELSGKELDDFLESLGIDKG